jgi:hypothetical protein
MLIIVRNKEIIRDWRLISLLDYLQACEVGYVQEWGKQDEPEGIYGKEDGFWAFVSLDEIFKNTIIDPKKFMKLIFPRREYLQSEQEMRNQTNPSLCQSTC